MTQSSAEKVANVAISREIRDGWEASGRPAMGSSDVLRRDMMAG